METVYKGVWTNWSHGPIRGATLTLSERNGGLLISFVAAFVAIVGAQLWRIIGFVAHQTRSTDEAQDGLHHQQQAILRNSSTPGSAAWSFCLETRYWSGRARNSLWRTLPWCIFSLTYLVLFGVLSTFSSQVSNAAGPARLIAGAETCGIWATGNDTTSEATHSAYLQRMSNESVISSTYARACYGSNPDPLSCSTYPVPALKYSTQRNATCPFSGSMCVYGDTAAVRLSSEKIDSHKQLGINTRDKYRVELLRDTTCAPLIQRRTLVNGSQDTTGLGTEGQLLIEYAYGSVGNLNYTYRYNTVAESGFADESNTGIGYTAQAVASLAPHDGGAGWQPIDDLAIENADVDLIFIASNAIRTKNPIDDPVFGSHWELETQAGYYYFADEYNVPIACTNTYRICDSNPTGRCTHSVGVRGITKAVNEQLDLNNMQLAIVYRISLALMVSSMASQVSARTSAAIRATDSVHNLIQTSLPADQWEVEVTSWFEASLARLQFLMQEYATGPAFVPEGSHVSRIGLGDDDASLDMCYSQMINDTLGTTSFSILGLSIMFSIGGFIILLSLVIDTIIGWLQTLFRKGLTKKQAWLQDDKLQMQRVMLERAGLGTWESRNGFPVTMNHEEFKPFSPNQHQYQHGNSTPLMASGPVAPVYVESQTGYNSEITPNDVGNKDSDMFVKEMSRR